MPTWSSREIYEYEENGYEEYEGSFDLGFTDEERFGWNNLIIDSDGTHRLVNSESILDQAITKKSTREVIEEDYEGSTDGEFTDDIIKRFDDDPGWELIGSSSGTLRRANSTTTTTTSTKSVVNDRLIIIGNEDDYSDYMKDYMTNWKRQQMIQQLQYIKNLRGSLLGYNSKLLNDRLSSSYGTTKSTTTTTTTTMLTTTTDISTTATLSSTSALISKQKTEEIPTPVVTSISVAAILALSVLVSLVIYFRLSKSARNSSATKKMDEFESISMVEIEDNPKITESTGSITKISSLEDLWRRIKEDDNYQPTYTSTTNAPLAVVLNK